MKPAWCLLLLVLGANVSLADAERYYLSPGNLAAGDAPAAEAIFKRAITASTRNQASEAYRLARESLATDPTFEPARKLLSHVKLGDGWHTPFEARQLKAGKIWHDRFGWLPADSVPRYEKGERYYRGRWMSAEQEAKLRANIDQGWRIDTDHYRVVTNDSLEAGVELAKKLERLHCVWSQLFAGYVIDQPELLRRFQGKPARERGIRQHEVVYFRSRGEYNDALRRQQPNIELSLGVYFDNERTAYFFAGEDQDAGTLWHEATHQLFSESRPTARNVGRKHNFWAIEGVACYMESLEPSEDHRYVTLGAPGAGRLPAARKQLLVDNFYLPLAELSAMSMTDLQADPNIAKIYSQAAGLVSFFLHAEEGRYRQAFVDYLRSIYDGRADESTLAQLTGRSYAELDAEYRQWLLLQET
jgi:hypothetical protein